MHYDSFLQKPYSEYYNIASELNLAMEKVAEDYNTVHNLVLDKFLRRLKTLDGSDMTEDILGQFLFDYIHNIGNQTADTNIKKIMIGSAKRMRSLKLILKTSIYF